MTLERLSTHERKMATAVLLSVCSVLVAHHYVGHAVLGEHPGTLHFALSGVASWAPWIILLPAIQWLSRRYAFGNVMRLSVAGVGVACAVGATEFFLRHEAPDAAAIAPATSAAGFLVRGLAAKLLIYTVLVAAFSALSRLQTPTEQAIPRVECLQVDTGDHVLFVDPEAIDWVEAAGNYVVLHVGQDSLVSRTSLLSMEGSLDPARFVRIHRSTIVNVRRVREMTHWSSGDYRLTLTDGTTLRLSRTYRRRFDRLTGRL